MLCLLAVGSFAQFVDQLPELRFDLCEILAGKRFLRPNQYIDTAQLALLLAVKFAQYPLHVIALHRTTRELLTDNQSDASVFQHIWHVVYDQELP